MGHFKKKHISPIKRWFFVEILKNGSNQFTKQLVEY